MINLLKKCITDVGVKMACYVYNDALETGY